MTYFNTLGVKDPQLELFTAKTMKQDDIVMSVVKKLQIFSATSILNSYPEKILMTSLRRSINTLLKEGKIIETGNKVLGGYGRNENEYKLN